VLTAVFAIRMLDERLIARQCDRADARRRRRGPRRRTRARRLRQRTATLPLAGLLGCGVALASGTVATPHQKRHGDGIPLVWGTAVQYAAASLLLLAAASATESFRIQWTSEFVAAPVWLVLVLSLGAVLLLLVLLCRGSA
jgi:drug/metabolite transporter (DMT)-like permease